MKLTGRKRAAAFLVCAGMVMVFLTGCGSQLKAAFEEQAGNNSYELITVSTQERATSFVANLAVGETSVSYDDYEIEYASAAGLFDLTNHEVVFAYNMHSKLYMASLTKLMTALVAVKYGSLDQTLTATDAVTITESGAQLAGISAGDTMTLEQALNILLIYSANDVANLIAENIGGSVDAFVEMMNEEANALGATNTHFTNPHGLHDNDHYTTVYDLYLIFQEAVKYEAITQIISQSSYSTTYYDSSGNAKNITVNTTNAFFRQLYVTPENITILGGKTGYTDQAGQCLALYVKDVNGNPYIGIILHSYDRDSVYGEMKTMLELVNTPGAS
ncbi:MAG: serine hydrolase [Lachnospiraceae bacterium]|nr:serine hydrolase [Lachnospiraceae bacterium]